MRYLIDSDWTIDALAGNPAAVESLGHHSAQGLAISIISIGEVYGGAYGSRDPETHLATFRRFLSGLIVLGLTDPIMDVFARTRLQLRRQGLLIPDFDLLIAATALTFDLTLMTRNRRHFSRIPDRNLYDLGEIAPRSTS